MRVVLASVLLLALLAGACAESWVDDNARQHARGAPELDQDPSATPAPPSTLVPPEPASYVEGDCPMDVFAEDADRVRCGVLDVAIDRNASDGPRAQIAVAVLASTSARPLPDPVLYLHGGPGGLALSDYAEWTIPPHPLLDDRDLILIDQRGSGLSQPSLNCPEAEDSNQPLDALADCADELRDQDVELEHFSTADIAADLVDLRQVLGIEQWNVYGVSYGSRVALNLMAIDRPGLRSAVLDSPYPPVVDAYAEQVPNAAGAIDAVLSACADDARCGGRFGDLRPALDQLLEDLAADPIPIELEDEPDQPRLVVDDAVLASALFSALYDRFTVPDVPRALQAAIDGDLLSALELLGATDGFARAQDPDDDYDSLFDAELAFWAPECSEEIGPADLDQIVETVDADDPLEGALLDEVESSFAVCERLDLDDADPGIDGAIESDVPTLALVGQFDPITPPEWARRAVSTLSRAAVVEIPGSGHAPSFENCPRTALVDFVDQLATPPASACLDDLQPLPFLLE